MKNDSSDEEWSDVEEEVQPSSKALCLFCQEWMAGTQECLGHMANSHNCDIMAYCQQNVLDFYGFVRLINFIRKNKIDEERFGKLLIKDFESEEYFRPVLEDDGLLQINFDEILESFEISVGVEARNGRVAVPSSEELKILEVKLEQAEHRALTAEDSLARALVDLDKCRTQMKQVMFQKLDVEVTSKGDSTSIGNAYFESYAHHGIHEEMLKDRVRTKSYQNFMLSNPDVFQGKVVLDVGCGTGILSMFAAKAGAKLVFAVDQSEIVYQAMDIVRENGLQDIVKVIKGNVEKIVLPDGIKKVDIIISEWMGYFLLFESMLDSIIRCRDKFLGDEGVAYPDCCSISMTCVSDENYWDSKIGFWDAVYGCKMSCMKKYVLEEAIIDVFNEDIIISKPVEVKSIDVMKAKIEELDFKTDFDVVITKSAVCTGMIGHFDIGFQKNLQNPISFSTGSHSTPTHWKQTMFLFEKKLTVQKGDILKSNINCRKDPKDKRALIVELKVEKDDKSESIKQTFSLN